MTEHQDTSRAAEAQSRAGSQRRQRLLFSQYPSAEVLADMRAMLTDVNQVRALWRVQFGLDEAEVGTILDRMHCDWIALWHRFGIEVDSLSTVPVDPEKPLESVLIAHAGLAEAIHAFEEKWARFIPARLTRAAS